MDASLRYRFTSDTSVGIDISMAVCHWVCVCYPAHFPCSSAHIRRRNIQSVTLSLKRLTMIKIKKVNISQLTNPGPMKPFLASSMVNLRVIRSSSFSWQKKKKKKWCSQNYNTKQSVQKETTHWICTRVNLDASLSTSKGYIHHCTLEGH